MSQQKPLIIVLGPSGSGKNNIIRRILASPLFTGIFLPTTSVTSRPMRVTETEGKEYFFRTLPQFLQMVDEGRFLEHQNVYPDTTMEPRLYGTLWSEIDRVEKVEDKIPMLEVDLHGGVRVREVYGDRVKLIFIMPRSIEDLVEQIKARDPSLPPDLEARMIRAKQEMEEAHDVCDYIVHNHPPTIEPAAAKVEQIIHEILLQHQVLV